MDINMYYQRPLHLFLLYDGTLTHQCRRRREQQSQIIYGAQGAVLHRTASKEDHITKRRLSKGATEQEESLNPENVPISQFDD